MRKVIRTEIMEVKKHDQLSKLCHLTKNLYNRALFLIKEKQRNDGSILSYYELDRALKEEEVYKLLPAQTAQQTLKLLVRNWRAFFQAIKEWKKHPQKFFSKPLTPKYKRLKGEMIAIVSNQQAKIVDGWIKLPKKIGFTIQTRLTEREELREVRIIPRGVGYTVEVVYYKTLPTPSKKDKKRKGAIDLGLVNLVTFVDNIGNRPIVIKDEGIGVKSITQYYLKEVKKLQQQYTEQQRKRLKNSNKLVYGKTFLHLRQKWRWKMKDWLHTTSRFLVELWEERQLSTVFIGYNPL